MQTLKKKKKQSDFSMNAFNILVSAFGTKLSFCLLPHFKWVFLPPFLPFFLPKT